MYNVGQEGARGEQVNSGTGEEGGASEQVSRGEVRDPRQRRAGTSGNYYGRDCQ